MKLIDKSTLAAAIAKRYKFLERKKEFNSHNIEYEIRMSECQHLMLLFNTIETKEVDLEKEYEEFVVDDPIFGNFITNDTMGMELAKHFFELGLKAQKEE